MNVNISDLKKSKNASTGAASTGMNQYNNAEEDAMRKEVLYYYEKSLMIFSEIVYLPFRIHVVCFSFEYFSMLKTSIHMKDEMYT